MSITNREKMLLHIYRDAAGMGEAEYRRVLAAESGCESSADREFERVHFVHVMARIEALLWTRVESGAVPRPAGTRYIQTETYWREQLRRSTPRGFITTAQIQKLNDLWNRLREPLGEKWTRDYFTAIATRATGKRDVGVTTLTSAEAKNLIDALQDKLTHALKVAA